MDHTGPYRDNDYTDLMQSVIPMEDNDKSEPILSSEGKSCERTCVFPSSHG